MSFATWEWNHRPTRNPNGGAARLRGPPWRSTEIRKLQVPLRVRALAIFSTCFLAISCVSDRPGPFGPGGTSFFAASTAARRDPHQMKRHFLTLFLQLFGRIALGRCSICTEMGKLKFGSQAEAGRPRKLLSPEALCAGFRRRKVSERQAQRNAAKSKAEKTAEKQPFLYRFRNSQPAMIKQVDYALDRLRKRLSECPPSPFTDKRKEALRAESRKPVLWVRFVGMDGLVTSGKPLEMRDSKYCLAVAFQVRSDKNDRRKSPVVVVPAQYVLDDLPEAQPSVPWKQRILRTIDSE